MQTYDLSPLYRATIGFDRMSHLMERLVHNGHDTQGGYPHYNIERKGENGYRISIAAAGFSDTDMSVEVNQNTLVVSASKAKEKDTRTFLHRGIAARSFRKTFELADHVHVSGALHEDGMLHIDLIRQVPETLRPRRIEITPAAGPVPSAEPIGPQAEERTAIPA